MNKYEHRMIETLEKLEKVVVAIIQFNEDTPKRNFKAAYLLHHLYDMKVNVISSHLQHLRGFGALENGMEKSDQKGRLKSYRVKDLAKMKEIARLIFEDHAEDFA